jgi:hypothetical protein
MNNISHSVTCVAGRVGQPLISDSKIIRFLQKARRNSAAVIGSNRINSLEQKFRTDSVQKPYKSHAETAQDHPETVPRVTQPSVRNPGQAASRQRAFPWAATPWMAALIFS